MNYPLIQGYLDSLCGVYALVNAEKIINKSTNEQSQELFNSIIIYLSKKRLLKDIIINGINHRIISKIINDVVSDRIPSFSTNKRFHTLKEWWCYSSDFLKEKNNRVILLSIGGREDHITVATGMTDRGIKLFDSGAYGGIHSIRKSTCRLSGTYDGNDKYLIWPSQCWYLGKE